jgi:hypothetical protein
VPLSDQPRPVNKFAGRLLYRKRGSVRWVALGLVEWTVPIPCPSGRMADDMIAGICVIRDAQESWSDQ